MRIAFKGVAAIAALVLTLASATAVRAQIESEPVDGFAGTIVVDAVPSRPAPTNQLANIVIYDNTASPANFGFSSTDLLAVWGDELFTVGTGILSTQRFSIFNAGSSLGPLLTATVSVSIFDAASAALLGSYNVNVNFGAGLNPGFFSNVLVTNLDPLAINLTTTDIVVMQRVTAKTGTANRLGIASLNPPTVGASPNTMYIQAASVNAGTPGFYTIASGPANPLYQLQTATPPVPTRSSTWGQLKRLYR